MSLHQPFDLNDAPGFTRSVDPRSARRQLRVSLGVAAALAVAIGSSAFALRPAAGFDAASQRAHIADVAATGHHDLDAALRTGLRNGG